MSYFDKFNMTSNISQNCHIEFIDMWQFCFLQHPTRLI